MFKNLIDDRTKPTRHETWRLDTDRNPCDYLGRIIPARAYPDAGMAALHRCFLASFSGGSRALDIFTGNGPKVPV